METIITTGGKGVQIKDGDVAETVRCLQAVMLLEKLLGEKIPGSRFEAGRIVGGKKKQKQIEKRIAGLHSWVRFLQITEEELLILTPSLKALEEEVKPLTPDEIITVCRGTSLCK
ncbi:MAG: hypothetical protein LUH07_12245 [Lachnospiraceae bacterium]|nr:hypothetical protein [Lachnospiraceae bacterium]